MGFHFPKPHFLRRHCSFCDSFHSQRKLKTPDPSISYSFLIAAPLHVSFASKADVFLGITLGNHYLVTIRMHCDRLEMDRIPNFAVFTPPPFPLSAHINTKESYLDLRDVNCGFILNCESFWCHCPHIVRLSQ